MFYGVLLGVCTVVSIVLIEILDQSVTGICIQYVMVKFSFYG